ncbi:acyltransferase family protein [Amnibacterium setariae]|uniref:Acyltransferase n=1 Tax=Amnibacterium setariae TaxID=2306585 RepID=A0A3A1TY73_9MICO|nr:acyltransferase [Amnibacterium setariae]RIX26649.1 acyltransferase [Amnibacterium setariae]
MPLARSSTSLARGSADAPQLLDRLRSLDGLRGVAAVVVLLHHALLTVPVLARAYYEHQPPVPKGSVAWWITYSPLHLAWAGPEAVVLFFVLSGLVVALPVLRRPGFDWIAFYPRRVVRIAGPAAVALAFGVALMLLVPHVNGHQLGEWMNRRPNTVKPSDVLTDLGLVEGSSGLVSPLWSLQWELLFSAFLPLFIGIAVLGRRRPFVASAVIAALTMVGAFFTAKAMFYLPLFAIGALLVAQWDRVAAMARRVSRGTWAWPALVVLGLVVASSTWWLQGLGLSFHRATLLRWTPVPGIVLLLLAGAFWRPAVRVLESRVLQWLGHISFSLYLVHEPIVVTMRFLLMRVEAPTWASIAIALPVAFAVAALFTRFVEAPFHRLARSAGRKVSDAYREYSSPERTRTESAVLPSLPAASLRPAPVREKTLV